MEALEFSAYIEQGVIRLPEEFRAYSNAFVRIIILAEKPVNQPSKKERLREVMLKMGERNIFSKITDAVKWQKEVRNEWE